MFDRNDFRIIVMHIDTSSSCGASRCTKQISSALMSEFATLGASESTLAYVRLQDVDHDAVMEEFARRYPEEYEAYVSAKCGSVSAETTQEQDELLQRAIELKRAVYRKFYAALSLGFLEDYVDSESQVYVSELELDQSAAMNVARCDSVVAVSEYVSAEFVVPEGDFSFDDLTWDEVVENLDLSNQISRADYLRDTKNLTGSGVKIGIIETKGVPDTTNPYLQNASIIIRSGDTVISAHATIDMIILAAVDDDGTKHGIVPDATFYCARVYAPVPTLENVAAAFYSDIEWMISSGVNIINASMHVVDDDEDVGTYESYSQWVDHIATVHDVHFVAAAGNNDNPYDPNAEIVQPSITSYTTEHVTPPGMAYNAITVGGFCANGSDEVAGFSLSTRYCYAEKDGVRPEKPNLVANAYFGDFKDDNGILQPFDGTSFAAPQVTGAIAQLCCWDGDLKYRQNVVGAVLAASAAEKVDAIGFGYQGDVFRASITGSNQISDMEGAGILDARWAWGILANENYWNIIQDGNQFPYEMTVTINTNIHTITRVAIFWTKNNTDIDYTTNELGSNNPDLTNFDLYVYDSQNNLIASSATLYSNFEIVQFIPEAPGTYIIKIVGSSEIREYVGLAIW